MVDTSYSARTDADHALYQTGEDFLDCLEALLATYEEMTLDDLAMDPARIKDAVATIPEEVQLGAPEVSKGPIEELRQQPEFADWRVTISSVSEARERVPLYDWPGADDEMTAVGMAVQLIETMAGRNAWDINVDGMWLPYQTASNRDYYVDIAAIAETEAGTYRGSMMVGATDGTATARLELQAYDHNPAVLAQPLVPDPDGDERSPLTADEISRAREENWARLIVGSHAHAVADQTRLSFHEALVHLLTGLDSVETDKQAADMLGRGRSSIATIKQRAREKYDEAPERIRRNERTREIFDDVAADDVLTGRWASDG